MNLLALKFVTYFDHEYSLRTLALDAYVHDARLEVLGCGFRPPWGDLHYADREDVMMHLRHINWRDTAILCRDARCDALILHHCYGVRPAFIYDVMTMARTSDLPPSTIPYDRIEGKRCRDLRCDSFLRQELAEGCKSEVELTWQLFTRLRLDERELQAIDEGVRVWLAKCHERFWSLANLI